MQRNTDNILVISEQINIYRSVLVSLEQSIKENTVTGDMLINIRLIKEKLQSLYIDMIVELGIS